MHPFEQANLGKAPFRCTHVTVRWFSIPGVPGTTKPGSSCDYCGTGIAYEYWIKSSDEKTFKVGCDCVLKTHAVVDNFKQVKREFARQQKEAKYAKRREAREAAFKVQRDQRFEQFQKDEPAIAAFLLALSPDYNENSFIRDMRDSMIKWGSLTGNQTGAIKRMIERAQERAVERDASEHFGTIGQRFTGEFEIVAKRISDFQTQIYGAATSYWYLLKMGTNVAVYRGTSNLGGEGEKIKATFTVKDHKDYKGTKQTVLARPHF